MFYYSTLNKKLLQTEKIETIFNESISLNPTDPFPYCWLGTYYKEVKLNFEKAEKFYKTAISYAEKSKHDSEKTHPLFFNNYGLLIIDKVIAGLLPNQMLCEAKKILQEAYTRNERRIKEYDFYWAAYNLDYCNKTISYKKVLCE